MSFRMVLSDGWDCARFLELVLNFGSFPFSSFVLSQPPVTQAVRQFVLKV